MGFTPNRIAGRPFARKEAIHRRPIEVLEAAPGTSYVYYDPIDGLLYDRIDYPSFSGQLVFVGNYASSALVSYSRFVAVPIGSDFIVDGGNFTTGISSAESESTYTGGDLKFYYTPEGTTGETLDGGNFTTGEAGLGLVFKPVSGGVVRDAYTDGEFDPMKM